MRNFWDSCFYEYAGGEYLKLLIYAKNIKPISSFNVELINNLDMGEHSPQYNPFNKDKLVSEYEKVYMGN
ncbi:hypothetical protein [Klebsiella pneumoniae ISC21]|nr:hypothetical protein [Klebsiella pneumoniae ISC21]